MTTRSAAITGEEDIEEDPLARHVLHRKNEQPANHAPFLGVPSTSVDVRFRV